jgi:hypothetical protein
MFRYKIKHDCFAYDGSRKECSALNRLYCMLEEDCRFYKTRKQARPDTASVEDLFLTDKEKRPTVQAKALFEIIC